jgi:hypothetical protein
VTVIVIDPHFFCKCRKHVIVIHHLKRENGCMLGFDVALKAIVHSLAKKLTKPQATKLSSVVSSVKAKLILFLRQRVVYY